MSNDFNDVSTNMKPSSHYRLSGLEASVEILIDRWGIPHIYASSTGDVYFAQGFNAARDRLWQLDLWRRRGLGLLSEVLGPEYVAQDRAARLFLYRGNMDAEWPAYGSDTREMVTSFVEGINAFIEITKTDSHLLPEEFNILGYKPSQWRPEDVVRIRSHGLTRNVESEVARALTLRKHGSEAEKIRQRLEPGWDINIPEGLDLNDIPEDVLHVYTLATQDVFFDPKKQQVQTGSLNDQIQRKFSLGSNSWVIAPQKTETGRPLLANDPHRLLAVPALRYMVHLSAPGLNVIGAGEPVLPGISIGHNGKAAFGLTIFKVDQEDLYVYETNPDNPSEYLYEGKWEAMTSVTEKVPIKGAEHEKIEMSFTRHGPVIYEDENNHRAFAVRAAWLEPGMAPYLGSASYMGAQDWETFSEAMNHWGAPSENQVYADVEGNIGWKPGGLIPVRPNWDGLLPVPGDGRYEWDGFHDQKRLPSDYNPQRGWIATANEMNLPDDYPYEEDKLGFEWDPPFRYQRIAEVIEEKEKMGIQDSVTLQTDDLSIPARRIVKLLRTLKTDDTKVSHALQMFQRWDYHLAPHSAAAALFEVWHTHYLRPAVVSQCLPADAAADIDTGDVVAILNLLENPDERWGEEAEATRDHLLLTSLEKAIQHVTELLGPNMNEWRWGDLHQVSFEHPLSQLMSPDEQKKMNTGSYMRGGNIFTVGNTGYDKGDFRQRRGATFRMVLDVGNWDASVAINSPGQSGNLKSKHYDDLVEEWANDEAIPLLYSREKIEAATRERIVLTPISADSD